MRVAVIGSGIVGSSVGWHLARRGAEVVMIDAGPPGAGVTNWTVSWVNASNKTETRACFELNVAGMTAHRQLAADLGSGDWWHPTGHLRWFDDPVRADALRGTVDRLRSWGYDVAWWKAEKVRLLLEPDVRFPSDDTDVAFCRDEGWVDGRALVARLVDEAVRQGAEVHLGRAVTDVVMRGDHITEVVVSGDQRYRVDAVVNAAGPAGGAVARFVGRTLPMRDEPGLIARLRSHRALVRRVMHAPHVELRPDGQDQLVVHSREIDALIDPAADTEDLAARLHRLAIEAVPDLSTSELIEAAVAWRPLPGDGFPSVGAVDGLGGYYEAVTHSGMTLGVIVGRLLAQEIMDGTVDDLLAPYRPGRFVAAPAAPPPLRASQEADLVDVPLTP